MRKLKRLWRALERTPGLLHVPACWEEECGNDFALVRPYLRPTNDVGSRYPCPFPRLGDCPRRIIDYGDGKFAAICRDERRICDRVPLSAKEALIHELDLAGFLGPVLEAAAIRTEAFNRRSHAVWGVGLSHRRDALNQPAFFLLSCSTERFNAAARDLLLEIAGQFLIVAPTNRHRSAALQERLQARGIGYVCLEDQVLVDERGRFSVVDPVDSADRVSATPREDRKRVVKEFTIKHRCKVADIQKAAGVYETDYYGWLNGKDPDHYSHCVRIEQILQRGLPNPLLQKFS